ncbi:MAG: hypothetical protein ABI054_04555 [Planctomycetota bacterium]
MGRSQDASRALSKLRKLRSEYGEGRSRAKLELIAILSKARLARASQVLELHESLLFLRAYPDDAALLERVERELARFERRADLRRHREELASSGIAGTPIDYPFFPATAAWLVGRFGKRVTIDWDWFDHEPLLIERMPLFALWGETPALDELDLTARQWFQRMKSPRESDAEFFVRRVQALPVDSFVRERFCEELDVPMRLAWGPGGPSRTHAKSPVPKIAFQTKPLQRPRPDLRREVHVPPLQVHEVSLREGARLVALAREAMVTRSRDLDAFMHGDPRDVRLVDCGENLQFACIGVKPERRLLLESVYGFLTLKNGVPIGYVLCSALMASSEIAYNVFDTYRGAQAAHVYSRALAMVRALFGADTFTIYPYQLGYENDEGLKSGAWWFYQKLGFRSRERGVLRSMDRELGRMVRDPAHRSSRATLKKVVPYNVYLDLEAPRDDVIGIFPLAKVGESITRLLARRFGSDRERATRELSAEARSLLGSPPWKDLSPEERQACERWAPLVFCLEGVETWTAAERRALFEVMRAKGGRRESDFVARFDAHARLRAAFRAWQKPVSQRPSR